MATAIKNPAAETDDVWRMRCELAACYRLCAHYGWDDHIATHMSARLPDGTFRLDPFGMLFDEITASKLMRVDFEGNVVEPEGQAMNPAAFTIHSGILEGREDVNCVIHLHTRDGVAVSALEEGLLPINQNALTIHHDIAYHEYEGIAEDLDQRERLQRDIADKNLMILRNHGTLSVGHTIAAAFYRIYTLEWACTSQIAALSMGRQLHEVRPEVIENVKAYSSYEVSGKLVEHVFWPGMLRLAGRVCPGYDS